MAAAESVTIPPLAFTVPAGFRQLSLADDATEREAALRELAADVNPHAGQQARGAATAIYELMARALVASGVEFAALGLLDDGDGGVAHCSLTVAAMPSDHSRAEVAANGIKEIFVRDPLYDTRWLDLPCGPAVGIVSVRDVPLGTNPDGGAGQLPVGQIQVHVPFPHDPWIALFTMETTALEQWDQVCAVMADMTKSIRFAGHITTIAPTPQA